MSATPEEKALIKAALRCHRNANADTVGALLLAAQAVVISRRPAEGPEPIPCMVRAEHSAVMFCHLPKGHPGSEPERTLPNDGYGWTYHEGVAANGNGVRTFKVSHQLINGVWERVHIR
jgi:hypothetical protein